jgi:ribose 5-phosphate isomerase B
VDGVRAAPGQSDDEVKFTREHNDANVLTLGAKYMDQNRAMELVDIFLNTEFAGGRHARRVAKIAQLEK